MVENVTVEMKIVLRKVLKDLMHQKDMNASQLARATGISSKTIQNWLAGHKPADIRQLLKVAKFFGVTIEQLCFGLPQSKEILTDLETYFEDEAFTGVFEVTFRRVKK